MSQNKNESDVAESPEERVKRLSELATTISLVPLQDGLESLIKNISVGNEKGQKFEFLMALGSLAFVAGLLHKIDVPGNTDRQEAAFSAKVADVVRIGGEKWNCIDELGRRGFALQRLAQVEKSVVKRVCDIGSETHS